MPGTRAQALAPTTLQHPDEADPAIAMVALDGAKYAGLVRDATVVEYFCASGTASANSGTRGSRRQP